MSNKITKIMHNWDELEIWGDAFSYIWESWLVWELYSLNNTLFRQYTPSFSDCTLDCNISDVSENSQIHIQRIGSWISSNQLKLWIKKVWTTTNNLIVEVRKWVPVTVTANAEAYWYGNQVIATWTIPYWSITSSYQNITVTLDNYFWWNEWELLDVVVYMNSVDGSNYYQLACDATQYSEAFSYVSVNWSTRTRKKLMPYCLSDWFASSLLVKTAEIMNVTWTIWTFPQQSSSSTSFKIDVFTCKTPTAVITANSIPIWMIWSWWNYYWYYKTNYWINDVIDSWWTSSSSNYDLSSSRNEASWTKNFWNITLSQWQNLKIWFTLSGSYWSWRIGAFTPTYSIPLPKKWNYDWKPISIKWLWNIVYTNLLWLTWDNFYFWKEVTTANAWSISPTNFVWYLYIWNYKIPYYN